MAHLSPSPDRGFNTAFTHVSFGLNPLLLQQVAIMPAIAEVKTFVIQDGAVTLFADTVLAVQPGLSTFHKDDGSGPDSPQHEETGLDPQPDPPRVFVPKASKNDDCDD